MIVLLCGNKGVGKDTVASIIHTLEPVTRIAHTDPMKEFVKKVLDFDDEVLYGPSERRGEPDLRYVLSDDIAAPDDSADEMWRIAEAQLEQLGPAFVRDLYPGLPSGLVELAMRELRRWLLNTDPNNEGPNARQALQTLGTEFGRDILGEDVWVNYALRQARKSAANVVITDGRYDNELRRVQEAGGFALRIIDPNAPPSTDAHASEHGLEALPKEAFDFTVVNDKTKGMDDLRTRVTFAWQALRMKANLPFRAVEADRRVPRREPEAA